MNTGNRVKYLFFWGHKKELNISKSCLSQWYDAPFKINNIVYKMAEHYMMSEKALLFCDQEIYQKIIQANHPSEAKKLGRIVKNFDQEIWRNNRSNIVIKGNLAKFSQNTDLKEFLMKTGDRVLVEPSPRDIAVAKTVRTFFRSLFP